MKLALLSSTLLLGTALAAPVPAPLDASNLAAPASSQDSNVPLDLGQEVGSLFAGAEGKGTSTGNALGLSRRTASTTASAAVPTATGGLDLEKTLGGLLGAANGEQTGNSGLGGGLKARTPQDELKAVTALLGDLGGPNFPGGHNLPGGLRTRTPQDELSAVTSLLGDLGGQNLPGGLRTRTPQDELSAVTSLLGDLGGQNVPGGQNLPGGLKARTPQDELSAVTALLGDLGGQNVPGGQNLPGGLKTRNPDAPATSSGVDLSQVVGELVGQKGDGNGVGASQHGDPLGGLGQRDAPPSASDLELAQDLNEFLANQGTNGL